MHSQNDACEKKSTVITSITGKGHPWKKTEWQMIGPHGVEEVVHLEGVTSELTMPTTKVSKWANRQYGQFSECAFRFNSQ